MTNNKNTPDFISKELEKYNVQDAEIAKLGEKFLPLKINGLDDTDGYELVKSSAIQMRTLRITVENKRKELKADALQFGRAVDGEAKRIQELIAPIESHLVSEKTRIDEEKAAQELAAKNKAQLPNRLEKLATIGLKVPEAELLEMDDAKFFVFFQDKQAEYLVAQEEKQAAAAKKLEEERQALEAEKKALEDEKQRAADIKAAEERAAQAERDRIAQEQADAEAAEKAAKAKAAAAAAAAPDKEKLLQFAEAITIQLTEPELATKEAKEIMAETRTLLEKVKTYITTKAEKL